MPNWCSNTVIIKGDIKILDEIQQTLKTEKSIFDFEALIPVPKIINNTAIGSWNFKIEGEKVKLGTWYHNKETGEMRPFTQDEVKQLKIIGFDDWKIWKICHWGTKWNAWQVIDVRIHNELTYFFMTAWSPPSQIYRELIQRFPDLKIAWFHKDSELGNCGRLDIKTESCENCNCGKIIEDGDINETDWHWHVERPNKITKELEDQLIDCPECNGVGYLILDTN